MGNESKNQTSNYLPMFCSRSSSKDIILNNHILIKQESHKDEPSSPKVSCTGQVKRNNRVATSTTTTTTTTITHNHENNKYPKLKKLFSSKTLLLPSSTTKTVTSRCCKTSRDHMINVNNNSSRGSSLKKELCDSDVINIAEMDPPLPVVKKVGLSQGRAEVNIWKRRFCESGLKNLQIEQMNLPNCKFLTPTTSV